MGFLRDSEIAYDMRVLQTPRESLGYVLDCINSKFPKATPDSILKARCGEIMMDIDDVEDRFSGYRTVLNFVLDYVAQCLPEAEIEEFRKRYSVPEEEKTKSQGTLMALIDEVLLAA